MRIVPIEVSIAEVASDISDMGSAIRLETKKLNPRGAVAKRVPGSTKGPKFNEKRKNTHQNGRVSFTKIKVGLVNWWFQLMHTNAKIGAYRGPGDLGFESGGAPF